MELDTRSLEGLSLCADITTLSDKDFNIMVQSSFACAARNGNDVADLHTLLPASDFHSLQFKHIHASLLTLATEASRHDAKSQDITSYLEDHIPKDRLEIIIETYTKYKTAIREVLALSSINFSTVVDVKWRLDYFIQSNFLEQGRSVIYFISLTTRKPDGKLEDIEFRATLEDLHEIVAKFREALNAIKNIKF